MRIITLIRFLIVMLLVSIGAAGAAEQDGFWSAEDLAQFLGVPIASVRYWAYQGTGPPSYKLGRRRKYKPSEVKAWADAQLEDPYASVAKVITPPVSTAPKAAPAKTTAEKTTRQIRHGRAKPS